MIAFFSAGVPATAVYLVSPRSMAALAAALILSGVSKSGSPAPSPMTFRPCALRSAAFWVTAMVGDGLISDRRAARNDIGASFRLDFEGAEGTALHKSLQYIPPHGGQALRT